MEYFTRVTAKVSHQFLFLILTQESLNEFAREA
jgi:hypothetical protein